MIKCASWSECLQQHYAISINPDKAKARSLIETAIGRIKFLENNKIQENNANYIFENYYSSAIEIIHVLALNKGFKIENHICLGYFLKEILKKERLFRIFDDCRYKRNSLVYYGRGMDFKKAEEIIKNIKDLILELNILIREGVKDV